MENINSSFDGLGLFIDCKAFYFLPGITEYVIYGNYYGL